MDYDVTTYRPHPELTSVWWDSYILGNADPTVSVTYQLTLPENTDVQVLAPSLDPPHSNHVDGKEVLVWTRNHLPAYRSHVRSGITVPAVHISSMTDWRSVDDWYHKLFASQTKVNDAIRRQAHRIMTHQKAGLRLGAVLQYVEENINTGVEFDIVSQPRPASCAHPGKGDCKDMTAPRYSIA